MTIFGVGYRSLRYEVEPRRKRWWPVLVGEFRTLFRNKWGVFIFIACLIPSVTSLALLLLQMGVIQFGPVSFSRAIQAGFGESRENARSVLFYLIPIYSHGFLPFLVLSSLVTCRAISKDRQTNALEIYWTRGIAPAEYFAGKWLGSAVLIGVPFVIVPVFLWILGVFMADDWSFLTDTVSFMPAVVISTVLFTLVLTYMATAFSAMSKNPNMAAVMWMFLIVGSQGFGGMMAEEILEDPAWWALSPWQSMGRLVRWMCGVDPPPVQSENSVIALLEPGPEIALVMVLIYCAVLTAIMLRKLRMREAVA